MSWEIAVALKIFGGSVLAPIVFRLLGDVPPRERIYRIMLQYAWTILFAMAVALIWGFAPSSDLGPIVAIGALMPFAVFFQWRAMAISPSRTGIFMEGTGIIPLLMSAILLDEWKVLGENQPLLLGFALVLISVVLHTFADIARKQEKGKQISPTAGFLRNSVSFMLIFSVATFLQNYWAKTSIHTSEFLVAWYVGASAGSIILFMATRHLPRSTTSTQMSFKKENFLIFLAGVSIVALLDYSL